MRTQGKTVSPQNSKYASSTRTTVPAAARSSVATSFFETVVPVGLLGLARATQRARFFTAATIFSMGRRKSSS